ncbi:autotransporter outer membrane beta-barrel domain-containing protein [Nordella sp. HKS 07]|uniref:autotransporter outer membrane beta-barrel domain-containing protein n=1 Tax=Nordella sp. HKS 07 TaxID=2712222 RepID=UPI0013E1BBEA|nr:autotransporter outer membrane beta-barrel domain-containing protein [Nordella sp. HKS 07]QIG47331.1 autotransporter outer membrane beta-barrel domain-containing protein [Nordella sp. HKS 07]
MANGAQDLVIAADGLVTGEDGDGIHAEAVSGRNLTITTGARSNITGEADGIDADNDGTGDLFITIGGTVTAKTSDGIDASNSGVNLTITAEAGSAINANYEGIDAQNDGTGDLTITANGAITTLHTGGNGIGAENNGRNLTITTGAGSFISAGDDGIYAENDGAGNLTITVNGIVEGRGDDGIYAENEGADLAITTEAGSVVSGANDGIDVRHETSGAFQVTVKGAVTGTESYGIRAVNTGDATTDLRVAGGGLVQGDESGIWARSLNEQAISIANHGTVRNLSGEADGRAITTTGGAATISNDNQLVGTVSLGAFGDTLNNSGLWEVGGVGPSASDFGDGDDVVDNTGALRAAHDGEDSEFTELLNLETFNNSGVVSLIDGHDGDTLRLSGATEFVGHGGRLAIDGFLSEDGATDKLVVDSDTSGTTRLVVNLTNPAGSTPNYVGLPVIFVGGSTDASHFDVEGGVLNAGFFAWDLRLDGDTHELYTSGLGAGAHEFAAGITAAQDIWQQTTGTLLQRQADLRPLLTSTQVTPVADFSEPVAPAAAGRVGPGFWFKAVGGYLDRDGEEDGFTLDRKQTVFGGLAGFDIAVDGIGDAMLLGLFGGYVTSDLKFSETNTKWTYEGPTLGVYATYVAGAFYADAVVKADFLDVDIDPEDLAPAADDAETDAFNLGGQIDLGYRLGLDHGLFAEPQASLALIHTEIDDVGVFGGAVSFDDETSLRGRLGLRLGHELIAGNAVIYSSDVTASVWQDFSGDNDATITAPLFPTTGVADDPGQTIGDVSVGFSVIAPDGLSGFLRGHYQFAEDLDAVTGHAGLRYAW